MAWRKRFLVSKLVGEARKEPGVRLRRAPQAAEAHYGLYGSGPWAWALAAAGGSKCIGKYGTRCGLQWHKGAGAPLVAQDQVGAVPLCAGVSGGYQGKGCTQNVGIACWCSL